MEARFPGAGRIRFVARLLPVRRGLALLFMSTLEAVVNDLARLPAPQLEEVARFVRARLPEAVLDARREHRLAALAATAGCLQEPGGEDFEKAVLAEAARVHPADWP